MGSNSRFLLFLSILKCVFSQDSYSDIQVAVYRAIPSDDANYSFPIESPGMF